MEKFEEMNNKHFSTRNLNKKITDIISKNKFTINNNNSDVKKELQFFKNEILKDMRNLEAKQAEKLINFKEEQTKVINSIETKFLTQNEKITYLSNMILDYFRKEKFEKYYEEFKKNLEKNFAEMASKIYSLQGELKDVLYKQESFFNENILYPGVIGYQCKFKNFHDFIDYVLETIHKIEIYHEILKSYELHKIQKNLENDLNTMQNTIKNNFQNLTKFTTEKVNESEQKMLRVLQDYNSQFVDVRMENNKNADKLRRRIEEVEDNFDQIIKIRKEIIKEKEEQEKKIQNIIQNIDDNANKIDEHNKEIKAVDTKFNLLTTYIDMQNEDYHNNPYNNMYSRNYSPKRIKSAKDFIARQMRLLAKGENFINIDYNSSFTNQGFNYYESYNRFMDSFKENAKTQIRTINNISNITRNFAKRKKIDVKGDSFIKRYITGKIGIKDMYNHPKDASVGKSGGLKYDTSQTINIKNFSQKNDKSNLFNLTKIQSNQDKKENNSKKEKLKMLKINNNNFHKQKNMTKSLSDNNYNSPNTKLVSHENFVEGIKSLLNIKNKNNQFNSLNNKKTSYNKLIEQKLGKDKGFIPKKRKKLLIIQ